MSNDDTKPAMKRMNWNPFQKLEGEPEALSAARAGALVGGYLMLSHLLQFRLVYWTGKDLLGNVRADALIVDIIGVLCGALLTWTILARQSLWASMLVALWFGVELAAKALEIAQGTQEANIGLVFMFIALAVVILSVRGIWALRSLRRSTAK